VFDLDIAETLDAISFAEDIPNTPEER